MGCSTQALAADTLEIFALRVQFAEEKPDNSLTTGNGTFDSDTENKSSYKLDPPGHRNSEFYWSKHFDFANAYYKAASNNNIVIKSRIFPKTQSAYKLKKQIIDYNRTSKMDGEKTAEFDEARSRDYLQFIYDAVMTAHNSGDSPFEIPLSKNPNTRRAYMIIHAGASRLVDGGSMGTRGADTPGDFLDVYIGNDTWEYLPDSLANVSYTKDAKGKDSVANGIVLKGAATDTLRSIMVLSETASQDGLNWGINGIMVNQIGRELGLPDTYDYVKGISRLGYFDVMDFAGYNAGNGFLPAMPAAWERAYMGWSKVKEVHPISGKEIAIDIHAAGTGGETEIVKVPLSPNEYLLIENRQRSWNDDGTVSLTLGENDESSDIDKKTFSIDSLNLMFEDSVCTKGKCKVNSKKPKGIILGASSFDAGIPASGIIVWRVNEWYLREWLSYGVANVWGGDAYRDHQFGIAVVESDGVLSIGKTFKNALGEDTYDYGSGTDLLPHLRLPDSSSKQIFDTVKTIGSSGYANTMTTQGGYTGITISVDVPKDARKEKTANSFMGDSVLNFGAKVITVKIGIDDGNIRGSKFPRNIGLKTIPRGATFVQNPDDPNERLIVVGAKDGSLQMFSGMGDTLYVSDTVITKKSISRKDQIEQIPLYRLGKSDGELIGMASDSTSLFSLHKNALVQTKFLSGLVPQKTTLELKNAKAGPMILDNTIWVATSTALKSASLNKNNLVWNKDSVVFKDLYEKADFASFVPTDIASCSSNQIVVAAQNGNWIAYTPGEKPLTGAQKVSDKYFKVACTDMDRDDKPDIVFVGSRGTVFTASTNAKKPLWPAKTYKRGAAGNSGLSDETSGFAIGDINNDGYPEVVFMGDNLVYALDKSGLPISGFPITISRGSPIYGFLSDPLLVDINGDDVPEILIPSSDGLIYGYTGSGKSITESIPKFPLSAGSFMYTDSTQTIEPMSIFVSDAVPSSKSAGPELYVLHRDNISAFRLKKADGTNPSKQWSIPAGSDQRTGWFDASILKKIEQAKERDEITEFFMFPNPVKGGKANAQFEIGAMATSATLELYDITGLCVYKSHMDELSKGRNRFEHLDLTKLGSDIYTAKLKVKFSNGKTRQKLYRVGVVR
ncbi:MAG: hypothetical protein HUK20_11555 [Fibrobacter sp.]|nr:hypothetical protein [Fibrobacter sp.]